MLTPKNWKSFQHYNKRNPPWIKLHKSLLDDRKFQTLPDASRALAPMLWLIAAEHKDGIFDGSVEEIAFRVRQSEQWVSDALNPLIDMGLFTYDSSLLASCKQHATPETERETEREAETETEISSNKEDIIGVYNFNPDEEVEL